MYNTLFDVKYHTIEQELLHKIANSTEHLEYSIQDVHDICYKLYLDELSSVFGSFNYIDFDFNDVDDVTKNVYVFVREKMLNNHNFKELFQFSKKHLLQLMNLDNTLSINDEKVRDLVVFSLFFHKNVFYITHKCICQQINNGCIDELLLDELKSYIIVFFNESFGDEEFEKFRISVKNHNNTK